MSKVSIEVSKEDLDFVKEFAAAKGMTQAESLSYVFHIGVGRKKALMKYDDKQPPKAKKPRKAKKASTKKAKKKSTKKASTKGKRASKSKKSSGGKKVTDAELLEMKEGGMSNPQIAKETGLSKDQIYRRIRSAKKKAA